MAFGPSAPSNFLSWRAILVGLLLIPINHFWVVQLELVRYSLVSYLVPYYTVIFILVVLASLNRLLVRSAAGCKLEATELALIYIMLAVSGGFPTHNMLQILVSSMGHAFWFATPENDWANTFWRFLPSWLTVADKEMLAGLYGGDSTLYEIDQLSGWLIPALAWIFFTLMLVTCMLSINTLVRKQWSDHERLTFPIIQLPMQIIDPTRAFFKSRLMWIGFAVAAGISLLNGLQVLFPFIPSLKVTRLWLKNTPYFTSFPWNHVLRLTVVAFYPFAIGIGFLMPLDLAFSVWFFFVWQKIITAIGLSFGLTSAFPYLKAQMLGAYLGLGGLVLWAGKSHLMAIVRHLFVATSLADTSEPMPYRLAFCLAITSFLGLVVFSTLAGMSPWVAVLFFSSYFIFSLTVTRIHTELGYPVHDMEHTSPQHLIQTTIGSANLAPSTLTVLAIYRWFNRTYASNPMPHHLDGFQIGQIVNFRLRHLSKLILVTTVVGLVSGFWVLLHTYYNLGGDSGKMGGWASGFGRETFSYLQGWFYYPSVPDRTGILAIPIGLLTVVGLALLRSRFLWWPFHPLGYPIVISFGGRMLWVCLLISSTVKWLVLRNSGWQTYRKLVPFFLGLTLGDFMVGSLWTLLGLGLKMKTYDFWP